MYAGRDGGVAGTGGREVRAMDNRIYTTSIRISETLAEKIKAYADETGATVNSAICILLDLGLKVSESDITIHRKGK